MLQSGNSPAILKKAYEISYAVFRIAGTLQNFSLRDHLERQALALLDAAAVENYAWTATVSKAIEYLMRFGSDVGVVNERNAEMVIVELNALNVALDASGNPAMPQEIPLDDIFAASAPQPGNAVQEEQGKNISNEPGNQIRQTATRQTAIRQRTILEKIRQSGNCRLRDILEFLPDVSERTIRYDLQTMLRQNLIDRVGSGGPMAYYRVRGANGNLLAEHAL